MQSFKVNNGIELLRAQAVHLLKTKIVAEKSDNQLEELDDEKTKLIQELEIHQTELMLQNEELLLSQSIAQEFSDKYIELFDFAPTGYFTLSKEGDIVNLNLSGANLLGKERFYFKNNRFGFFITDESKAVFNTFLKNLFDKKIRSSCEVILAPIGSEQIHVILSGTVIENGELCLINVMDITKHKSEQLLINAKNKELASQNKLIEKRSAELAFANKELIYQNEEKEKRSAELVIANMERAFEKEETEKLTAELRIAEIKAKVNEEKEKLNEELILTNKELSFQIYEKELLTEKLIIAKDKAEESEKIKSAFLANMSHEIRTPMNGILGFTQLLKKPDLSDETRQKFISMIEQGGERMLEIINDLIDISKIQSGMTKVNLSTCNVNEMMEYTFSFFKPEVEKKGMRISYAYNLSEQDAVIETDREKVYAVMTNLVKNAIKYTLKGHIEIGYQLNKDCGRNELMFFVKDTGLGISKDKLDSVFGRFVQLENKNHHTIQGVGLGLSISKSYIEMLKGRIWVESELGKGSTFFFSIPYFNIADEVTEVKKNVFDEETDIQIRKLKILIADDDELSSMLSSIILKDYSSEVFLATNGFDAIDICHHNRDIDLILMDINMPFMHGTEATRQIREFNKDVYIIAQSANVFAEDRIKIMEAGSDDFITKPLNQDILIKLIQNHFKE